MILVIVYQAVVEIIGIFNCFHGSDDSLPDSSES